MSNLAKLLSNLFVLFSFFAGMISFLWILVGTIPGIVLFVIALTSNEADKKKKYFKWAMFSFGGLVLLLLVIASFAAVLIFGNIFGISLLHTTSKP